MRYWTCNFLAKGLLVTTPDNNRHHQREKSPSAELFRLEEYVTWSESGGWSQTQRIMRGRGGSHIGPSSTMIFAPCHIPLIRILTS